MEETINEVIQDAINLKTNLLKRYDSDGSILSEVKNDLLKKYRKNKIKEDRESIFSFFREQLKEYMSEGDFYKTNELYIQAIESYKKAMFVAYFTDIDPSFIFHSFEINGILFYKLCLCYHELKMQGKNEVFELAKSEYEGYDADYGALINSIYYIQIVRDKIPNDKLEEYYNAFKSVGFDYRGAVKVAVLIQARIMLLRKDFKNAIILLEENDYKLINDNMYIGRTYNRLSEQDLVSFTNTLLLCGNMDFIKKVLDNNCLIRDCYQKLISI